jgi:hypothetical protein
MRKRDSHIFEKDPHGHYVEPSWCSERLFEEIDFGSAPLHDPACGWGTITRAANRAGFSRVTGSDIVDRKNHKLGLAFRKENFLKQTDPFRGTIVCNPPFDLIQEFVEHSIRIGARHIAMIMLVRRLNAARWLQALPLRRVMLLTPRPSMPPGSWISKGNKPGGGTQDFCWIYLQRGYQGKPELSWLQRVATKDRKDYLCG